MTTNQSNTRLWLYVGIAMLSAASAGLMAVDFTSIKEAVGFILSVLTTGAVTARSYIDKSPSEVQPQKNQH